MAHSLDIGVSHQYRDEGSGIGIPIRLHVPDRSTDFIATLDTRAAFCIFERRYAELPGLDPQAGRLQRFSTVTGLFAAYEHEVTIETLGFEFSGVVYFSQDDTFGKNFIGRSGWLDRVRMGLIDYDRTILLGPD